MAMLRIEPLTRVEGAGRIELQLDGQGHLHGVELQLVESYRLFESLVLGRDCCEVPALVCRICAICSGVHRIAASMAIEDALEVKVPPAAALLRELLVQGGQIESHALHLFCLILPDLRETPSVLELLARGDAPAAQGLSLKRLGNRLQELAGGRMIHPVNIEVGGVVARPPREELQRLADELAAWEERLPALLGPFADPAAYPPGAAAVGLPLAVTGGEDFALMGTELALPQGRTVAATGYHDLLGERPLAASNAKRAAGAAGPFLVGALARLRLHGERSSAGWCKVPAAAGIHGNNIAQACELPWSLARSRALLEALLQLSDDAPLCAPVRPGPGVGTAVIEAPRGLLVHHYVLDDFGRVARADIVTPTAINQLVMERQLLADLQGVGEEAVLRQRAERIVRAYDPCISCSVHVLRK